MTLKEGKTGFWLGPALIAIWRSSKSVLKVSILISCCRPIVFHCARYVSSGLACIWHTLVKAGWVVVHLPNKEVFWLEFSLMYFLFSFLQLISEIPIWHWLQVLFMYLLYNVSCSAGCVCYVNFTMFFSWFLLQSRSLKKPLHLWNLSLRHSRLENSSWLAAW